MSKSAAFSRPADPEPIPHYQQITLPDGTILPGHDRSYLNQIIFDSDVSGQTMLDIGCHVGFFCIEGLTRGMSAATGLEPYPESIRLARQLADRFGVRPRYLQNDFETWQTDETYDIILCLNVLHHMYDPVHAIRRMMQMARRKIVLEVALPTVGEMAASHFSRLLPLVARNTPLLVCGRRGNNSHAATRTFLFNHRVLETIFNYHSCLYEPIQAHKSPLKERLIITAQRRVIRHLTIIAGPSGCGKSTFQRRLLSDPAMRRRLNLPEATPVATAAGNINEKLPTGPRDHVILHYDALRPFGTSLRCYDRDPACDLIRIADKVTILTLVAPGEQLRRQLANHRLKRISPLRAHLGSFFQPKLAKRHRKLLDFYASPGFLDQRYTEWFDFCSTFAPKTASHILVETGADYRFHPLDDWNELSKILV